MLDGQFLTIWSVRLSLVFFFLFVIARITASRSDLVEPEKRHLFVLLRWLWTFGTTLYVIHVCLAFHFSHNWSHDAAVKHTAQITEKFTGWYFGGGIWLNHLFTLICVVETAWMWIAANKYWSRGVAISCLIYGYLLFIAVNASVIFVSGPARWVAATALLLLAAFAVVKVIRTRNLNNIERPQETR